MLNNKKSLEKNYPAKKENYPEQISEWISNRDSEKDRDITKREILKEDLEEETKKIAKSLTEEEKSLKKGEADNPRK
ncbi:MAG: hypothetical protein MUO26_14840 [Methanotrichaceae archaeon]|nr:hypothetical protein [Methanotrichaceae archaeon]